MISLCSRQQRSGYGMQTVEFTWNHETVNVSSVKLAIRSESLTTAEVVVQL